MRPATRANLLKEFVTLRLNAMLKVVQLALLAHLDSGFAAFVSTPSIF